MNPIPHAPPPWPRGHPAIAPLAALFLGPALAFSQVQQPNAVQDASGLRMTNGVLTSITAGGQSVAGLNASDDGRFANYSGFLAGILLRPMQDTDGDGLCDEMDRDNDGDALFDFHELVADTDPTNATSVLSFLAVDRVADGVRVAWKGGTRARQVLMRRGSLTAAGWMPLVTNLPPTPAVTNFVDRAPAGQTFFYRVTADRSD